MVFEFLGNFSIPFVYFWVLREGVFRILLLNTLLHLLPFLVVDSVDEFLQMNSVFPLLKKIELHKLLRSGSLKGILKETGIDDFQKLFGDSSLGP